MSRMEALLKRHSSLPRSTSDRESTAPSSTALKRSRWLHFRSMVSGTVALTENLFGGVASLQKPLSRGSLRAASTDPYKLPLVDYRTFSNPLDLQIMVQSVRFNTDIFPQTDAFKEIGAFVQTPETGLSDIQLAGVIRASVDPSFSHPSGTCAMLKLEDGGSVDNRLRLYGSYGRVRVANASSSCYPEFASPEHCVCCG
ncbi:hypothetical protein BJX62DRAFT_241939 [Aspergillus germanicus]